MAQETRISSHYLRTLEEDGPPDLFPAPVYARFFTREYADFLGLDPDPLLAARDELFPATEEEGADLRRLPVPDSRRPGRLLTFLVTGASVITLVALGIDSLWPKGGQGQASPPLPARAPDARPVASPADPAPEQPQKAPRVRRIRAVLQLSAPSWVEAVVDGERKLRETLPKGHRVALRARRHLELVMGDAGGVTLRANGRLVPTGDPGEVVRLSILRRGGRLIFEDSGRGSSTVQSSRGGP